MEPAHSPFGLIGQIARDTGWSVNYIMRGVNYPALMMMWSDYSKPVDDKKNNALDMFRNMEREKNSADIPDLPAQKGTAAIPFFTKMKKELDDGRNRT